MLLFPLLVLRHHGKVDSVVVGEVFHVVAVTHGAVVALTGTTLFHRVVVMESQRTADGEDNLRVALVDVQTARCARTKRGIHYLYVVVHMVTCVQMALSTLETREMSLSNLLEINNHGK